MSTKNQVTESQTLAVKAACRIVVGRVPHTGVIGGIGKVYHVSKGTIFVVLRY